jgi:hypothetical protein
MLQEEVYQGFQRAELAVDMRGISPTANRGESCVPPYYVA